eukprot:COSAG02_NODE_71806_length_189_cov_55.522222_1_plen_36_part_01
MMGRSNALWVCTNGICPCEQCCGNNGHGRLPDGLKP